MLLVPKYRLINGANEIEEEVNLSSSILLFSERYENGNSKPRAELLVINKPILGENSMLVFESIALEPIFELSDEWFKLLFPPIKIFPLFVCEFFFRFLYFFHHFGRLLNKMNQKMLVILKICLNFSFVKYFNLH